MLKKSRPNHSCTHTGSSNVIYVLNECPGDNPSSLIYTVALATVVSSFCRFLIKFIQRNIITHFLNYSQLQFYQLFHERYYNELTAAFFQQPPPPHLTCIMYIKMADTNLSSSYLLNNIIHADGIILGRKQSGLIKSKGFWRSMNAQYKRLLKYLSTKFRRL